MEYRCQAPRIVEPPRAYLFRINNHCKADVTLLRAYPKGPANRVRIVSGSDICRKARALIEQSIHVIFKTVGHANLVEQELYSLCLSGPCYCS